MASFLLSRDMHALDRPGRLSLTGLVGPGWDLGGTWVAKRGQAAAAEILSRWLVRDTTITESMADRRPDRLCGKLLRLYLCFRTSQSIKSSPTMVRQASVERKTGETNIAVTLNLDTAPGEKQQINVSTGVGFLDHVSVRER